MLSTVPHGSAIGLKIWNIFNNGIFIVDIQEGVVTIRYTDDLAILVRAKD